MFAAMPPAVTFSGLLLRHCAFKAAHVYNGRGASGGVGPRGGKLSLVVIMVATALPAGVAKNVCRLHECEPGIEVASLTDVGCQRENNEDSFLYWEPAGDEEFQRNGRLAVVADGMGGYEGGQEASRLAVETVREVYEQAVWTTIPKPLCLGRL